MAKLPRKTQKIFAENAPVNQVTAFGSVKAGDVEYTKDVGDIQTDAFSTGWAEAVQEDYAPYRQDVNAVYLAITKQLAYQFQEGVAEWDAGTTYFKGGIVKEIIGSEYKLYHSLIDNNINNPLTDTESWKLDFDSTSPFVSLAQLEAVNNSALHKTGNEEKSGNLKLVAESPQYEIKLNTTEIGSVFTNKDAKFIFKDKRGYIIGSLRGYVTENLNTRISIEVQNKKDNGDIIYLEPLVINYEKNGTSIISINSNKMFTPTPDANSNNTSTANTQWTRSLITNLMNNFNYASFIETNMTLDTEYTVPVNGLLCISILVWSQTDARVQATIKNNSSQSVSNYFADWMHNGGTAEGNTSPVTIPVKAGNVVKLLTSGGGAKEIRLARIFKYF